MYQFDETKPARDPLAFAREHGIAAFAEFVRSRTGYCCQRRPLVALLEALESATPLMAEGKRGCGKSAMGEAIAEAFNLVVYWLQCMEGLSLGDVLFEWDRAEQDRVPPEARWTRDTLILGEVAAAYEHAESADIAPILILDELDKLPGVSQNRLLQILERGYCDVPRLTPMSRIGVITAGRPKPFVYATSNDQANAISEPLRSRFAYTWINPPSAEEEVRIIRSRVPSADLRLVRAIVKMLHHVRHMNTVVDKPGLREIIKLTGELAKKGLRGIDEAAIERHICHFAKREKDVVNILRAGASIVRSVTGPDPLLDPIIDRAFASIDGGKSEEGVAA